MAINDDMGERETSCNKGKGDGLFSSSLVLAWSRHCRLFSFGSAHCGDLGRPGLISNWKDASAFNNRLCPS